MERQQRQSIARLIPAAEKSEGISGYLNEVTNTHLFKTSARVNIIIILKADLSMEKHKTVQFKHRQYR